MSSVIERVEEILKAEYSTINFIELMQEIFDSMTLVAPNNFCEERSNFSSHIVGRIHVGNYTTPERKKIAIFAVQLKKETYVEGSRSTQRSYAKKLIEGGNCDAAIVAFYTEGDPRWRLSFVRLDYEMKIEQGKLKTTENITPAKRYSYLVGQGEPCHTAVDRLRGFIIDKNSNPSLDDLEEAFSVEKVTKEFFELYCEKFYQLQEFLDGNEDFVEESKKCGFTSEQYAKKLLGQIVFLYFLQKKGWLGVNVWTSTLTEKEYKNLYFVSGAQGRIIKEHLPKIYIQQTDGSYRLNTRALDTIPDDDEKVIANHMVRRKTWGDGSKKFLRTIFEFSKTHKGHFFENYLEPLFYDTLNENRGAMGYCPALHCRIPFLSGGLFEPLDGYDWKSNYFDIPDEIFSNKKDDNDRNADGILDIFDRYNFTMSEDEPMEREVAIDPEMLGKIFENLLEVKDRKSKGAFYTPREIVHYMCQESLINYLVIKTKVSEDAIRDFILYGDFMKDEDTVKSKREGNGGMYISEELFKVAEDGTISINRLKDVDDALASVKVADPAVGSGAFPLGMVNEIVRARENITAYMAIGKHPNETRLMYKNERSPYMLKYNAIRNSIFAVDIEPSAVDITQLRLWLSLVIDDEITPDAANELEGHKEPLALPNLECNILCGNSLIDEFDGVKLINESDILNTSHAGTQMIIGMPEYETILLKLLQAQDELFKCEDTHRKAQLKKNIQSYKDMIVFNRFKYEGAVEETKESYKRASKMASKPFVLWHLDFARVFRDNGGFDIVIGNPPYIKERDNKNVFEGVNNTEFGKKYHQGKMDYWYYFLHRAIEFINENGNISFITPRYWLNGAGASKLIERIKNELSFVSIVDIGNLKVFDNVVGYHMIAQYSKIKTDSFMYKQLENSLVDISRRSNTENLTISSLKNASVITNNNEIILQEQTEYTDCVDLGSISDVSQGVIEASDRISKRLYEKHPKDGMYVGKGIFVLSLDEIDSLELSDEEKTILVPYANGDSIGRYSVEATSNMLIYADKLNREKIASDNKFCRLKNHLDNMADYITSSNAPYGLHRPRQKYYFDKEKIIMPSMFAKNNFAIDYSASVYVGMSFSCIVVTDKEFLLEYVLAVLNSSVAYEWFYTNGKKRGAGVDIGVDKVKSFPVKRCPLDIQQSVAEKVKQLHICYDKKLDDEIDAIINMIYA